MAVKIRLQRHGKKGKPFYWVVAADARTKRDGRYLEKIGTYNPNTNPATIDISVDRAVDWLQKGAQPTDTARNLLSEIGAMLKNHLVNGVRKGAHSEEDVETKFAAWVADKENRLEVAKDKVAKGKADAKAKASASRKEVTKGFGGMVDAVTDMVSNIAGGPAMIVAGIVAVIVLLVVMMGMGKKK